MQEVVSTNKRNNYDQVIMIELIARGASGACL